MYPSDHQEAVRVPAKRLVPALSLVAALSTVAVAVGSWSTGSISVARPETIEVAAPDPTPKQAMVPSYGKVVTPGGTKAPATTSVAPEAPSPPIPDRAAPAPSTSSAPSAPEVAQGAPAAPVEPPAEPLLTDLEIAAAAAQRQVSSLQSTSVLGVHRGSQPDEVAKYEDWLGSPVPYALEFLGRGANWDAIANPSWVARRWNGSGRTVVFSVAMLPNSQHTLARGAAGAYDQYWRSFARTFVAAGRGDAILRLGWEFNGKFYPWAAGGKEDAFAAYWRRIVGVMATVPGAAFQYDWTPLAGNTNANLERAYPGDAYVDFIGLDAYDTTGVASSREARWANIRDRRYGLAWHRDFAAAHGKPMTFPEWGLSIRTQDGLGGGDNAHYIEQMHQWITTNNVAYAMYFEVSAKDAEHRLMTNVLPQGSEAFLRLFGG
jgi:hypothetical protein